MADDDVDIPLTEPERPADDAVPHLWPAELDADYTLLGELGRGGMAVVFRARDRELGREVAVKVVRPRFAADEEAVARLAREARTVAQLEHPNIVGVYSIRHLADRSVALVMQLIPGRTLKQAVVEGGPFDVATAEQVLRDIARALAYAHRAGVVHRDVKPENIFLDATSGRAMLSDFGVARVMDAPTELTATGTTIGTPTYMAPEQIDGVHLDGRSDLYSLGMVGWEMLTGERPWVGESLYSVIYRQKHDQLAPIDSYRNDIPPRTQYLIEGLMPKNPDRRWASAARFLTLLASDQPLPGFKEWESAQRRRRRSHVYQQARQRGESVIEAALETVKFSRPPTPVGPLNAPKQTPTAPLPPPEEQFFEPTGQAATAQFTRPATRTPPRAGTALALGAAGAVASGTPSGGFSIQRPPHEANTRLTPGVMVIPPKRSRLLRGGLMTLAVAALAMFTWIQFGPAGATELRPDNFPTVPRDDRAIDVPVVAQADSADSAGTDSATGAGTDSGARVDSATLAATRAVLNPPVPPPNARLTGVGATADSTRLAAGPRPMTPTITTRADSATRTAIATPPYTPPPPAAPGPTFPKPDAGTIAAGRLHSCALSDNSAVCWGANDNGQLGDGTVGEGHLTPTVVAGDFSFVQIATGAQHTCGLTTSAEVVCWGGNGTGQLGDGTTQSRSAPVKVNSAVNFRLIRAGRDHTCGLSTSRAVFCWGSNSDGQLGIGTRARSNSPMMVEVPGQVAELSVGWYHTCALTSDGAAWCWGRNNDGQLGDGYASAQIKPSKVRIDAPLVSIAAGEKHTCGVTANGEAWCWGGNKNGQLGSNGTESATLPRIVSAMTPFSTITAGGTFTCARGRDSGAFCWGLNNSGQLGDGTNTSHSVPVPVKGLSGRLVSLTAGNAHACAVTERNEMFCWGNNLDGQIGRGDRESTAAPTLVKLPPR